MVIHVFASSYSPLTGGVGTVLNVATPVLSAAPNSMICAGCLFYSENGQMFHTERVSILDNQTYTSYSVTVPSMSDSTYQFEITILPSPGNPGDTYVIQSSTPFNYQAQPGPPAPSNRPKINQILPVRVLASQSPIIIFTVRGENISKIDLSRVMIMPGNHPMTVIQHSDVHFEMRFSALTTPLAAGPYRLVAFDHNGVLVQSRPTLYVR